jgi:hypothetical protein
MGPSSCSIYIYIYIYNTTKLIELSIWIHIVVQHVRIIKVVEIVPCVMMRITILNILEYQKLYKKCVCKMLADNIISKIINMIKDVVY